MADFRYVEVDGVRLRTSIRGAGRPLLLLSGIGASLSLSAPFEDALNPHGVQTIAVDAPGTGGSTRYRRPRRMPGLARTFELLLDALEYEQVDVLGASFGGVLAQQLAHQAPSRVRRLVLAATGRRPRAGRPTRLAAPAAHPGHPASPPVAGVLGRGSWRTRLLSGSHAALFAGVAIGSRSRSAWAFRRARSDTGSQTGRRSAVSRDLVTGATTALGGISTPSPSSSPTSTPRCSPRHSLPHSSWWRSR